MHLKRAESVCRKSGYRSFSGAYSRPRSNTTNDKCSRFSKLKNRHARHGTLPTASRRNLCARHIWDLPPQSLLPTSSFSTAKNRKSGIQASRRPPINNRIILGRCSSGPRLEVTFQNFAASREVPPPLNAYAINKIKFSL